MTSTINSVSNVFTAGAARQVGKSGDVSSKFIGRKFGQRKPLEQKLMECAEHGQFLRVTRKGSEISYDEKVRLTSKTFINSPNFVVLFSCRLVGTIEDLMTLRTSKSDISRELKELVDVDLLQKMDSSNYKSSDNIEIYDFRQNADASFGYTKVKTTTFDSLFMAELEQNKTIKDEKKIEKGTRMFDLNRLVFAVYLLKENQGVSKMPIPSKVKISKEDGKPKENALVVRVRELAEKNLWMDVSHCKDNGSGVHGNVRSLPPNAYTFPEVPELSRCFFVPTRDTNPKSPTRGMSNVGVVNFLVYYFGASHTQTTKTRAECVSYFNSSFQKQKMKHDSVSLTAGSTSMVQLSKIGLDDL